MKSNSIASHFTEAADILAQFSTEENFLKIQHAGEILVASLRIGGKIISCGNGGSMCDAMHFAEELTGRYRDNRQALPAISISDNSHMSCVSNDYGYDFVFSRYLEALGNKGDVLLAISTSGNSKNVLKAVAAAQAKGTFVIGLAGKDGGQLAAASDLAIVVPSSATERVQEVHITCIHIWCELMETTFGLAS